LLICFVTIFARQKYRQNNFCFHIIALGDAQSWKYFALSALGVSQSWNKPPFQGFDSNESVVFNDEKKYLIKRVRKC
jgi:hypothetical protein